METELSLRSLFVSHTCFMVRQYEDYVGNFKTPERKLWRTLVYLYFKSFLGNLVASTYSEKIDSNEHKKIADRFVLHEEETWIFNI